VIQGVEDDCRGGIVIACWTMLASQTNSQNHDLKELFRVAKEPTLGRSSTNAVCLSEIEKDQRGNVISDRKRMLISRHHAKLSVANGQLLLCDLDTINGTYVNNHRIRARRSRALHDGDVVSLGGTNPMPFDDDIVPNPWTFSVRRLQDFLANYTTTAPATNCGTMPAQPTTNLRAHAEHGSTEVYTFANNVRSRTGCDVAGGGSNQGNGAIAVDFVDLTGLDESPITNRPGKRSKHSRGSSHACASGDLLVNSAPDGTVAIPASNGDAVAAAGPAADSKLADGMRQQFTCAICQELMIGAYSMVPCGHSYCAGCLVGWLDRHNDCPTCRAKATSAPIRQHQTDSLVEMLEPHLQDDEKEVLKDKREEWEGSKKSWEKKLSAVGKRISNVNGDHWSGGTVAQMMQMPGPPRVLDFSTSMLLAMSGVPVNVQRWQGGHQPGAPVPPPPQRAAPPVPPPLRQSHRHQYKVDYCGSVSRRVTCVECSQVLAAGSAIIGKRPFGRSMPWTWYHLSCLPGANWTEARVHGVSGLRSLRPEHQAAVRERMQF
jgi:hypothetical protein